MNSEKRKLTLSINSEVIEKAKELGLNLSEITEKSLKLASLSLDDKNIATPDKLREEYIDILNKISKILKKWDLHLEIGYHTELAEFTDSRGKIEKQYIIFDYILSPDQVYLWADYLDYDDKPLQIWRFDDENLPITKFYDPEKIIATLIDNLYRKAHKNKEIINKLQILKNILELSDLTK